MKTPSPAQCRKATETLIDEHLALPGRGPSGGVTERELPGRGDVKVYTVSGRFVALFDECLRRGASLRSRECHNTQTVDVELASEGAVLEVQRMAQLTEGKR